MRKARNEGAGRGRPASGAASADAPEERKEAGERTLVDSYGETSIYKERGEPLLLYEVPVPRYKGDEKALIEAVLDIASRTIRLEEAPFQAQGEKRERYLQKIREIINSYPELHIPANAKEFYAIAAVREMAGFGLIDPLTADDELEEIMVIGVGKPAYVFHRKYGMMKTNIVFYDDKDIVSLIDRIAGGNGGGKIGIRTPLLDVRLEDGMRLNATIRPVSLNGSTITLRKFRQVAMSAIDLINNNTLGYEAAAFLWLLAEGMGVLPANLLIAGGTGSGKTTTLNSIMSFAPGYERVISIEDAAELNLPFEHWVRFEVRLPGVEGTDEVNADALLKNALRMRPDRIIIDEIRGEEGYAFFSAMNTGCRGLAGTLHSNSGPETIARLASPPMNVPANMLNALNFIVMQQRIYDRRKGLVRRISEIAELVPGEAGTLPTLQLLYQRDPVTDTIKPTGAESAYIQALARYSGGSKASVLAELSERGRILAELNEKGVRELHDVCEATQNYALKKQGHA